MLNKNDLALEIIQAFGYKTKDNELPQASELTLAYAQGIINALKGATVLGTVTGTVPASTGALQNGAGSNHTVTNIQKSLLTAELSPLFSAAGADMTQVQKENEAICLYLQTNMKVNFASGKITGTCTVLPNSTGTFTGKGEDGTITGIDGNSAASFVAGYLGFQGSLKDEFYGALCDHIKNNAKVSYAINTVTGTVPAGGGSLQGGLAVNGIID